jgi:hypothetical protein
VARRSERLGLQQYASVDGFRLAWQVRFDLWFSTLVHPVGMVWNHTAT